MRGNGFALRTGPAPFAAIAIEHLGGAVSRIAPGDTAFWHRAAQHSALIVRMWGDPAESEANMEWARGCYRSLEPFLKDGAYVNYLGDEGEARVRATYGDVLVGYPAETEEAFDDTLAFIKRYPPSGLSVNRFSSERGTAAGHLQPLPAEVIKSRTRWLLEVHRLAVERSDRVSLVPWGH